MMQLFTHSRANVFVWMMGAIILIPGSVNAQEVSLLNPPLNDHVRMNGVQLTSNDSLFGTVNQSQANLTVYLLQQGVVVGQAQTNEQGEFELKGVRPGPYTIVGSSPQAFFAYSIDAVSVSQQNQDLPTSLQVNAIIGKANKAFITRLIQTSLPAAKFRDHDALLQGTPTAASTEVYDWERMSTSPAKVASATTISGHAIQMKNNKLIGRIHQVYNHTGRPINVVNTNVVLIQDGQMVAETQVNTQGLFEFKGLQPGTYGLLAFGSDGLLATSLDLVEGGSLPHASDHQNRNFQLASSASGQQEGSSIFDGTLSDPESVGWINAHTQEEIFQAAFQQNQIDPNLDPTQTNQVPQTVSTFGDMPYDYFSLNGAGSFNQPPGLGLDVSGLLIPAGITAVVVEANDNEVNAPPIVVSPFAP